MPRPRSVSDDQIISGTIAAIGKHGPARLTLAHVAEEVGITPAALVRRFGSKAGLLAAVASAGADYADAAFDAATARTASPTGALLDAIATFAGDVRDRTELANHMAMLQLDITDPQLRQQSADQAVVVRGRIEALLADAVRAKELKRHATAELADVVYTAYSGGMITWAIDGSGDLSQWLQDKVAAVLAPYRR